MSLARGACYHAFTETTDEGMIGGQKIKSRMTIKELSPTSYTFTMEMQGPAE